MPGRLRKGAGSNKALGVCQKCCAACCRVSAWNKLMCYPLVALVLATFLLLIGGAFVASDTDSTAVLICGPVTVAIPNSTEVKAAKDPVVPLLKKNANVWWLANAGVFTIIMVIMSLCCCGSYIALCCGFSLPRIPKILAIVGFIMLLLGLLLYLSWLVLGSYLISKFGPKAPFQKLCRGMVIYVVFMYIYLVIFLVTLVASCVWAIHASVAGKDSTKKSRGSVESKPKIPSTRLIKAMI